MDSPWITPWSTTGKPSAPAEHGPKDWAIPCWQIALLRSAIPWRSPATPPWSITTARWRTPTISWTGWPLMTSGLHSMRRNRRCTTITGFGSIVTAAPYQGLRGKSIWILRLFRTERKYSQTKSRRRIPAKNRYPPF